MEKGKASDARILKPEGLQASGSATDRDLRSQLAALTEVHERLKTSLREAIDGYTASHKYDHGEWHFDHNDLPSEECPECQAHRAVIAKWESALLSPREGTPMKDHEDQDAGLPGSAATKGL